MSDSRPAIPAEIARSLRQESGFGCARCGNPFIEYHHIIPWEQEEHFRAEDMVAVCPTCHSAMPKLSQIKQREIKAKAFNIASGHSKGMLVFDIINGISIGNNLCIGSPYLVANDGRLVLGYGFVGGAPAVYVNIFDNSDTELLKIDWNSISFNPEKFWDFDFKWNYVVVRNAPRDIFFELSLNTDSAFVRCKFPSGQNTINIDKKQINITSRDGLTNSVFGSTVIGAAPNDVCVHFVSDEYLKSIEGQPCPGQWPIRTGSKQA